MKSPTITPARNAAQKIMKDLQSGHLLDVSFERNTALLEARDRRWVQELVWGVLRNRERYDHILAARIRGGLAAVEPDVLDILRLGAYQLLAMNSVPPYAAIGQSVEATKSVKLRSHKAANSGAAKLVNAVLRRIDRERNHIEPELPENSNEALALKYSHPEWLVARWIGRWGVQNTEALLTLNNTPAPIVLRPKQTPASALAEELASEGVQVEPHDLVSDSLVVAGSVSLTSLNTFQSGEFFVQDPAATLVAMYAHIDRGSTVADLCAAPGGKALELARHARLVVASDKSRTRVARMVTGFKRMGALGNDASGGQIVALVADATEPSIVKADAVLVDAPCTGTGTFRRHPDARWRIKASDLAVLPSVQRGILEVAATLVKPGGLLIYSTCSLETEENDEPVDVFLAKHPEFSLEPPPAGAVPESALDHGRLRVLPHLHQTDGAFAARLRRSA